MPPISNIYDRSANVLYQYGTGALAQEDFFRFFDALPGMGLQAGYKVLADYTGSRPQLNFSDIELMAQRRKRMLMAAGVVTIALVADTPLVFGLARIYQTTMDDPRFRIQVFRTRSEAESWLASV